MSYREIKPAYTKDDEQIYVYTNSDGVYVGDNESKTLTNKLNEIDKEINKGLQKIEENSAQLSESVQEIENVNNIVSNKAEKTVVDQLKNQINSFQVEQSSGMTDTGSLELKAIREDILGNNFDTATSRINNIENILKNNISNIVFNDWEIGAIGDNGVDISTYPRIRTGYHAIENGLKLNIEVKDGYKLGIYMYDSNKKFISRIRNITGGSEFTISSYYIRLVIGKVDESQVELSDKANIDISYQFKEGEKQVLNINEFDKTVGKNICPPTFFEYIMSGDPLNGYKLYKSDSKNPCTYIFPCKPNMEYTLTIKKLNSDRFRIFESKILDIQYNQVYTNEISKLYEADDSNMRTFITGVETKAIIVYVNRDSVVLPEWCQCEEGKEFTGYEEYSTEKYLNANYNLIDKKSIDYDFDFKGKIISNILDKNYEPSSDYIDWNLSGNYLNTIYGWWDSLVSKYPEYVTKKTQGTDATGLPIYRYDFTSKPAQWNPFSVDKMKIIYLGGVHGHERKNMCEDFRFFKELCEKHNENSSLKMLYDNVYFIVVPAVCPWGVDNLKRVNSNGVNINRNFPSWWTYLPNDSNYNYSGETPASELETQAIIKLLDFNKDAVFVIDHHNSSGFADQGYLTFANMGREIDQRIIVPTFNRLDSQIKNKYPWILGDNPNIKNKNIYRTGIPLNPGTLYTEILYKGMHGMLLETSPTHNGNTILYPNGSEEDIQAITVESIGSILETVVINNNLLYS